MYSGSVKYRVYKKDIEHYRIEVFDIITKQWIEVTNDYPSNLTLFNCKLVVDDDLRVKCLTGNLQGADAPVHAWIECTGYIRQTISLYTKILYYNPFTVTRFCDRITRKVLDYCSIVTIDGNKLFYSI